MAQDKTAVITIDGIDYAEYQLTDKAKVCINHLQSLDQKIRSAEFNLDQLRVGRDAFMVMLKDELTTEGAE